MSSKNNIKNILFDLDGTIIDSYKGIQLSYNYAFQQVYNCLCDHNIQPLIGPPIKEILVKLSGETDIEKINIFVKKFQRKYDSEFYKSCYAYHGIPELLTFLSEKRINLYIATNKRLVPTELILNHLNLNHYFNKIYAIDSNQSIYESKVDMVADLIKDENLKISETILVGDTLHDMNAAKNNNIGFIYADYGFGNLTEAKTVIKNTLEIINFIN